jgi:hypothetical protein
MSGNCGGRDERWEGEGGCGWSGVEGAGVFMVGRKGALSI